MRSPHDDLIDRLAAEYVLGTLRGRARDRFASWLRSSDLQIRSRATRAVRRWEDSLSHLANGLTPVEPSPQVWQEIERRLGMARSRAPHAGWRNLALAASVAIVAVGAWLGRSVLVGHWELTAELREAPTSAARWRIELDRADAKLRIDAGTPLVAAANRSHELWALPRDGSAPVSLGLLPRSGRGERSLSPRQLTALLAADRLAVSLEPLGGSPTGAPTGPVVLVTEVAVPRRS